MYKVLYIGFLTFQLISVLHALHRSVHNTDPLIGGFHHHTVTHIDCHMGNVEKSPILTVTVKD